MLNICLQDYVHYANTTLLKELCTQDIDVCNILPKPDPEV